MIVLIGVLALAVAVGIAAYVLLAGGGSRVAVARTVAAVQHTYAVGSLIDRETPFHERVALPFARRLSGVGRAFTPVGSRERLQRWLDRAGNPAGWTVDSVIVVKGLAMVYLAAIFGVIVLLGRGVFAGLVTALIAGAVGFFLPDVLVYNAALRRQEKVRRSIADVLDMLTVSVEAGLGFDAALAQVARNARGPLAGESARALHEMQLGKSRTDALRSMADRVGVLELRTFTAAVVQASELGIPIAQVLREQSKEMRIRRRQHGEEKAQKVPVKILFPLIFFIFPALFIIVLGPAVIRLIGVFMHL
jgi:tight adherence protein C